MLHNLRIDAKLAPKFAEWQANRGGVLAWENQEIASPAASQVFTPATTETGGPYPKPNWRYDKPTMVDFASLIVAEFTPFESYRGRTKVFYWGLGLYPASEAKANRIVELRRLASPSSIFEFRWVPEPYGLAKIEIGELVRYSWDEYLAKGKANRDV